MRTKCSGQGLSLQRYRSASVLAMACIMLLAYFLLIQPVHADSFTDVFYTNSFRGSFEWFKKLDWVGMIVQAVISVFALIGTALIVIRIMTSMLYLSARGLWEEVHDLKQSGGESEMYDLGFVNMAKSWAKGKSGTGLDAFIGAILMLLPDIKRYSDFGEKSGQKFEEDTSISQYMLKILLPTVLSVFFLAMAFNGTLVKGLAVTVDAMGTIADKAVSVNYSGFVDDLVNSNSGYKFIASIDGSNAGTLTGNVQKEVYGKVVTKVRGANQAQLYAIGQNIESLISRDDIINACASSSRVGAQISDYMTSDTENDRYFSYIGYDVVVGGSKSESDGVLSYTIGELLGSEASESLAGGGEEGSVDNQYVNIIFKQSKTFDGSFINIDEVTG